MNYTGIEITSTLILLTIVISLLLIAKWTQRNPLSFSLTIGAILGGAFFIQVFNLKILVPTEIGWLMQSDWEWHFMGWHIFRSEPWHFPLGKLTHFWFPIGTTIGYTDSIPLLALLLKPWSLLLPTHFQYFGLWLLSCFILQGVFAALLLRLLTPHLILQTLGIIFFIIHPVLLHRFAHLALCAHWLVLAGLWLSFKSWPNATAFTPLKLWWILISLAATIHPYLTVMVMGLAMAFYAHWWLIERRCTLVAAGLQLASLGITILFLWWVIGYFVIESNQDLSGQSFGYYSMNLLAPLLPQQEWSLFFRELPVATAGQYEGFNYLGAGVLLLGAWSGYELSQRPPTKTTLKRLFFLGIICLGFTLLAISNKVTVGPLVLLEFKADFLNTLAVFRSSGRFFWPVNYALLFLILQLLIRRNRHFLKLTLFYFSLGLIIQEIDFYPKHLVYHQLSHGPQAQFAWENPLKSAWWKFALPHYQHITFIPPIACGEEAAPFGPVSLLAGQYGLTINTGRLARAEVEKTMQYCQQLFQAVREGQVKSDTIYIIHPNHLETFKQSAKVPLTCNLIDGINTCITEQSYQQWQKEYATWQQQSAADNPSIK
ncbi:hypothetical protein THII_3538 [Thioploca ingrica]|uniref:Uncharacterized protein n=1 Tax=Thioploca ingrica TaxID=40754 RepID=A0A090AQF1_9GAMM|nr:hypothetical protein THII_3538 [Thioploca ingrica]